MIETAVKLSNYGVDAGTVEKILELGKEMLSKPVNYSLVLKKYFKSCRLNID